MKGILTDQGVEYLEFNERQTKTRTGADHCDARPFAPKMFSTDGIEKDPVAVYKLFAQKRLEKMKDPDAPFYIGVNNVSMKFKSSDKCWFKCSNKLGGLMKEMSRKAGLENDKLCNHKKTIIQTLNENDVPPTQIAQLSSHKNLKSIENKSPQHKTTNAYAKCTGKHF